MTAPILIVDDREYIRQLVVAVLEDAGFEAVAIGSAAEALAQLPDLAPRLVMVDLAMPGMSGDEFLTRLRATPQGAALPVIVVTGDPALGLPVASRHGAALLPKPFGNGALVDLVIRLLDGAGEGSAAPVAGAPERAEASG